MNVMKTSFLDFIKNHKGALLVVLLVLAFAAWVWIREARIARDAKIITTLTLRNDALQNDRNALMKAFTDSQAVYRVIQHRNDSMKVLLAIYRREMMVMERQHQHEIDSLMSVPNDMVYVRLQPIYPNLDQTPLKYPFSGSQIRQIYSTAISYPRLQEQFTLETKALSTCTDLNKGYEAGISNLKFQVGNLETNIKKADDMIGNYKTEVVDLTKKVNRGKFWTRLLAAASGVLTVVAILK
jgi:hypothetical protein